MILQIVATLYTEGTACFFLHFPLYIVGYCFQYQLHTTRGISQFYSRFYTRLLCVSIKLLLKRNTLLAYFILQIYNAITKHGEGEIRDIKKTILMYET
jgi:hypothetical protein